VSIEVELMPSPFVRSISPWILAQVHRRWTT
jgi:hypothetical protein